MCFQRVRCCKTATFDDFCAISLATALEHHSANQFLKAATNLNVVQPKLFQASRQDDLRFSDCRVSVIQILDNADAAFRILCAYVDRSIRDHHVRRQAAPPQRTGYRAAISCYGTFETCRRTVTMSVCGGTAEVVGTRSNRRD